MVPAGYYTSPNTSYTDTCYINDSIADITFLMRDTYGDGMNGSYYVTLRVVLLFIETECLI